MRFCLSAGTLTSSFSVLRQYAFLPNQSSHRVVFGTRLYSNDRAIFKDSLERTLEAHRNSNRASLVRKVFDRTSSTDPTRRTIPAREASSLKPLEKASSPGTAAQLVSSVLPTRTARSLGKFRKGLGITSRNILRSRIQWSVNAGQNRRVQSPWMDRWDAGRQWPDGLSQLDAEIRALEEYLLPTPSEQDKINHIVSEVTSALRNTMPCAPLVIGSRRTGFAMSHSSLDFILPVPDPARSSDRVRKPSPTRPQVLDLYSNLLRRVKCTLEQCSAFNGRVESIGKRNSILIAVHHETGVRVQLHCGEGLPSSVEYIHDYYAEYPAIRPLYMVTRLILEARELFGRHKASIGPDTLVMLLVAFLKMNHGRFQGPGSLGEQLLAFLNVHGSGVDLTRTGVSVDPPSFFDEDTVKDIVRTYDPEYLPAHLRGQRALVNQRRTATAKRNLSAASRLCLQDPANYMNDIGRACSRTRELQCVFARAYDSLSVCLGAWKCDDSTNSLLASALQANFDDFGKARAQIIWAGRGSPYTTHT